MSQTRNEGASYISLSQCWLSKQATEPEIYAQIFSDNGCSDFSRVPTIGFQHHDVDI